VDGINPSSISKNCHISRSQVIRYLGLLESVLLIQMVWPPVNPKVMREPKILMMPPFRLAYGDPAALMGALREDYAIWSMRRVGLQPHYLKSMRGQKCPDFVVDYKKHKYVFEVGSGSKTRKQFKGLDQNYTTVLLRSDPPYNYKTSQPLWIFDACGY
jgi:predicted AAA+ superfamily ATPase